MLISRSFLDPEFSRLTRLPGKTAFKSCSFSTSCCCSSRGLPLSLVRQITCHLRLLAFCTCADCGCSGSSAEFATPCVLFTSRHCSTVGVPLHRKDIQYYSGGLLWSARNMSSVGISVHDLAENGDLHTPSEAGSSDDDHGITRKRKRPMNVTCEACKGES